MLSFVFGDHSSGDLAHAFPLVPSTASALHLIPDFYVLLFSIYCFYHPAKHDGIGSFAARLCHRGKMPIVRIVEQYETTWLDVCVRRLAASKFMGMGRSDRKLAKQSFRATAIVTVT